MESPEIGLKASEIIGRRDHRYATADSLLDRTGGLQRDGRDAILHKFLLENSTRHAGITDSKEEAVGDGLIAIHIVYNIKTIAGEHWFDDGGTAAILRAMFDELEIAIGGSLEHSGESELSGMGST